MHFIKLSPVKQHTKYVQCNSENQLSYLYSAAYFKDVVVEQSTSSPCNAKFTGQNSRNSPSPNLNFEGVTQRPFMDAALPYKKKCIHY